MRDSIIFVKRILYRLSIFIFWIIIWQIAYMIIGRDIFVPSPFSVFKRLGVLIFLPSFWMTVYYSMIRVLAGFWISVIAGLLLGVISGMYKVVHDILNPLMVVIKSTPVMSFIIVALLWFTSTNVPVFICFLICFPIIWSNVAEGIKNTDSKLLEMAKAYNVSGKEILRKIYLPSIKPYFFAACFTSVGLGWKASVAAEVLSHPRNAIGSSLYSAKVYIDSADLFAWTLVVIVLSLIFELLFRKFAGDGRMENT